MKFGYLGENIIDKDNIADAFKNFLQEHSSIQDEELEKIKLDNEELKRLDENELKNKLYSIIAQIPEINVNIDRFLKLRKKIFGIENNILEDIQQSVFNFLDGDIEKLPDNIKNTISALKDELGEGEIMLEDIKIEQFVIKYLGEEHRQVNFVLTIGEKTKSVSSIIHNETGEVKNLTISEKNSRVLERKLDNRNDQNVLIRKKDREESKENSSKEGIEIDEELEDNNNLSKNIFNKIVFNTWNEIFKKNKEELADCKTDEEKKRVINDNAEAIANLFTGILQGTVDFTHSTYEYIKDYFAHFLEKSPELLIPEEGEESDMGLKINDINQIEDGVIVANGTYAFELDGEDGQRRILQANFTFIFTKGANGNWTISGLHSYTD